MADNQSALNDLFVRVQAANPQIKGAGAEWDAALENYLKNLTPTDLPFVQGALGELDGTGIAGRDPEWKKWRDYMAGSVATLTAKDLGGGNLSEEQINTIAADLKPYAGGSFDPQVIDKTRSRVETLSAQNTQKNILDSVDKAVNPGKYLTPEQTAQNLANAQRLAQQYGQNDPDLVEFLAGRLAEGESAFEVGQFLQTTPQYLKKQSDEENARVQQESAAARQSLGDELLRSEDEAFNRAQPQILAAYMRAGRLDSSGVNSAVARERAKLAQERQGFLANAAYSDSIRAQGYRREDFVGANAQAFNQYLRQSEPGYQQRFNVQDASNYAMFQQPYNNLNRQYALNDAARQRQYELEDYDRQQSDYNRYMSEQRRAGRQNLPWQVAGLLGGAALQGWAMGGFGRSGKVI
jgi:hypothetical protein